MAEHTCPVWVGYLLASPLRRLFHNPERILEPYVKTGMVVLDIGCAMGFFSLPMARLVGGSGRVVCVDIQEKMLDSLRRRARQAGLSDRIETRLCGATSLGLRESDVPFDFALAFAVVHEVAEPAEFFSEAHAALKSAGRLLMVEPAGHVSKEAFNASLDLARGAGFSAVETLRIVRSHAVLLEKSG